MTTWAEAAVQALKIIGEPSSIPEIWGEIKEKRLYRTYGKTPMKTLSNEIRKHLKGYDTHPQPGSRPKYFVQKGKGIYGLVEWEHSETTSRIQEGIENSPPVIQPLGVKLEGNIIPEEIERPEEYYEGATKTISVTVYERDPKAREACIDHYGAECVVCCFNFEEKYGALGAGYIHVHHLRSLSEVDKEYQVDPINDLRPVCPNCHAMLHRYKPPLSIEELKAIIESAQSK